MYALDAAKQEVIKALKSALGKTGSLTVSELTAPPAREMGDLAYPCFALAKGLKRSPAEIASELAAKIPLKGFIAQVRSQGPYVNITLSTDALAGRLFKEVRTAASSYGNSTSGAKRHVLVEYANLNTHKEVHVGHLRNMALGQAVANVLAASGYDVVPHAYINDLGNNVAKCLWAYQKFHKEEVPDAGRENEFFGKIYAEATQKLEEDPALAPEVSEIQRELESGKGEWAKLWKKTNKWSLQGLKQVFDEFGLTLQKIYLESDLISATKKIVKDMIKRGIAVHSEGAWVVRLEEEGLGVSLLVKSDGTHLYNAKDLALAQKKEEEYHPDRSIYVVDQRQKLAFAQLFATLRRMGFVKELTHLSFGQVSLPEGAISSRTGTIVRYQDLRDEAVGLAREETRKRHENWSEGRVEETARAIAFAALKYGMLRVDPDKPVTFDVKEALSFDGASGPYLLYTIARCKSLLKKAGVSPTGETASLKHPTERDLVFELARFPEVISRVASDNQVSFLAQYLFVLGQTFARFYNEVSVLSEEDTAVRESRLSLVAATAQTMENGSRLLGIEPVDEM